MLMIWQSAECQKVRNFECSTVTVIDKQGCKTLCLC